MIRLAFMLYCIAGPAMAETIVAARTIPAQSIIMPDDVTIVGEASEATRSALAALIGQEARVALFSGRAIRPGDVGPAAVVERNQIIPLLFRKDGLVISTDGRALGRGGPGDTIRVMNLGSRATVTATITSDGMAYVER